LMIIPVRVAFGGLLAVSGFPQVRLRCWDRFALPILDDAACPSREAYAF
jgi:hypothetical protein